MRFAPATRRAALYAMAIVAAIVLAFGPGCGGRRDSVHPAAPTSRQREVGTASWYGREFAGRRTASGEIFRPQDLTAAHRTLPFGTRVRVVNVENGRSVEVRINDRGPFKHPRILDVSEAAARKLGFHRQGLTRVRLEWPEVVAAKP